MNEWTDELEYIDPFILKAWRCDPDLTHHVCSLFDCGVEAKREGKTGWLEVTQEIKQ